MRVSQAKNYLFNFHRMNSKNIEDRKLVISDPKSGKEAEAVSIPKRVAHRLRGIYQEQSDP